MKAIKTSLIIIDSIVLLLLVFITIQSDSFSKQVLNKVGIKKGAILESEKIVYLDKIDTNNFEKVDKHIYSDNSYEEEILNRDSNELYKLKKLVIDDTDAFMVFIYDPSKIKMMTSKEFNTPDNSGKERITDMAKRYGAVIGVNGGGFFDNGKISKDIPVGYIIKDNKVIWDYPDGRKGLLIGFSNDNKLMMLDNVTGTEALNQGMRDGLEFGPVLMRDGVITEDSKIEKWAKRASRLVLAQREDGIVIILATNGGTFGGARMSYILEELQKYNAVNVANLDGGASTQLVVKDELLTHVTCSTGKYVDGGRMVVNGWGLIP